MTEVTDEILAHKQSEEMDRVKDFLEHYGVMGMRWGVRKSSGGSVSTPSAPTSLSRPKWQSTPPKHASEKPARKLSKRKANAELKTQRELSEDQIVFNALRAKAKRGGITALSNAEIKVLTARAETLNQYNKTFPTKPSKKSRVAKFAAEIVEDVLVKQGKTVLGEIAKEKFTSKAIEKGQLQPRKKKVTTVTEE